MMALLDSETKAVRVVKLALKVDYQLGARLAGEVNKQWQEETVSLVKELNLPLLFKIRLLGKTKSDFAIDELDKALSDSNSQIFYKRRREKGVVLSKEYVLEVSTPQQLNSVFESLNNNNIKEASVTKTEHSEIIQIRKEVRIDAIKAAKEKAEYLLSAIDEEIGSPIEISEDIGTGSLSPYSNGENRANSRYLSESSLNDVNFKTIEVRFSYYVRFGIKEKE